jgi:hypothetical protein
MNTKRRNTWLSVVILCLILPACVAPADPPTSTTAPTVTREPSFTPVPPSTPTMAPSQPPTPVPTSAPASTPTPILGDGSGYVPDLFGGCWQFETEDVQFEIELEQRGADLEGTFLLIKLCVVDEALPAAYVHVDRLRRLAVRPDRFSYSWLLAARSCINLSHCLTNSC